MELRLEIVPPFAMEVKDRDRRSNAAAEDEAGQAAADEIDGAAQRAAPLAERNIHAVEPSIAVVFDTINRRNRPRPGGQTLRRKTMTVVKTVSLKRTTMCGVWYGFL